MKDLPFQKIEESVFIFSRKSIIMQREKNCNGKGAENW